MVCCVPIISLISTFSLGCAYGSGYFCSQQFCGKVKDKTTETVKNSNKPVLKKRTAEVIVNKKKTITDKDTLKILQLWKQDLTLSIKDKLE